MFVSPSCSRRTGANVVDLGRRSLQRPLHLRISRRKLAHVRFVVVDPERLDLNDDVTGFRLDSSGMSL
jgi:hypothetical protein